MKVKRSERMQVVLNLAEKAEQEAGRHLANAQSQCQQAEQQLQQLVDYNQSYIAEIQSKTEGLSARAMVSDREFLRRLGGAQEEQQQRLRQMNEIRSSLQAVWSKKYQYRKAIADLIDRLKMAENKGLEQQIQRQLDEMATQQYIRKR